MTDRVSEEEVATGLAYEGLHVPALFRQWAPLVAEAARIEAGQKVLDVACGTGILAREVVSLVGRSGCVEGLDSNPGMLAVAKRLAPAIRWRRGSAEAIPHPDRKFDAVVSQFGLTFFEDRLEAIREMRRVLVPGGRIGVAVWDTLENSPAYSTLVRLLDRIGGKAAGDALRVPFALGDREELARLFQDAGVGSIEVETHRGEARFPSIRIMVEAETRGWLPVMGVVLDEDQIGQILDDAEDELARYVTIEGVVEFESRAHIVSGNTGK